jgi:dolichyl-phosphate-mannose-protein mannosyltransferase
VGRRTAATVRGGVGRDLALITLAGLVLRLLFVANPGHIVDLNTFGQWALEAADNPLDRAYEATNANYPPGAILVFELIGRTYRALGLSDPVSLRIAVKAPSIVFDCLGGGVLFALAARFVGPRRALVAAALFDLNPAIIYDSSLWGQNDSITTVSALTAVWCLLAGRPVSAWIILAFAILNKPPVIVLVPLFWIHAFAGMGGPRRRHAFIQTAIGTVAALVFGYLIALPLYADRSIVGVYSRLIAWYGIGSSLYPYTSANAFNVYALFGSFFAPDDVRVLFVPIKYWADAAFGAIAAVLYWRYGRMRDDHTFLEAGFLVLLAFFLVLTEMHERYLIYALTFAPALAPLDRRYLWATLVLTLTQWLNLEYSLTYMWVESDKPAGIDPHEFAPVLVHLCALANIAIFGLGVRIFFEPRATLRRAKGTVAGKL